MRIFSETFQNTLLRPFLATVLIAGFSACEEDDDVSMDDPVMKSETFSYEFNNGQVVESAAYDGMHHDNLMADIRIEEMNDGGAIKGNPDEHH